MTPGNFATADRTSLATIVSVDPVYVAFDVDERTVLRLARRKRESKAKDDKKATPSVWVGLADDKDFPHRGTIDHTAIQMDPKTGTLRYYAVVANPKGILLPGMFARVRLAMNGSDDALPRESSSPKKP